MKKIFIFTLILSIVAGIDSFAQEYSDGITFLGEDNDIITVTSTASHEKKKEAQELAIKSAFNSLFHSGIDGLKNGVPMIAKKRSDFDFRFFHENRFVNYISGEPKTLSTKKIANQQRATVQLSINLRTLKKELEKNNLALNPGWSDAKKVNATAALNPTIVIVPYVTAEDGYSFESMRIKVENTPHCRAAIARVAEEFQKHGFKTRDFITQLQNSKNSSLLRQGTQTDDATMLVQQLPGDIVVTVDANQTTQGTHNSQITLNISAVEKQTAGQLASKSFASGFYMTTDATQLTNYAVSKMQADFFEQLNASFEDMIKKGREVNIEFNLSETVSEWDFDQDAPASGNFFKDTLEEWLRGKSFGDVYDMSMSTPKYIAVTINVPLWDYEKNRSYTLSNFGSELRKFMKEHLGDEYKPAITSMGQKIMVTVE